MTPQHHAARRRRGRRNPFGYPVFVKPARLGSSVGISKAHDDAELAAAVELAFRHDEKVLVEEFVDGVEVEVGVLGNRDADRLAARARSSSPRNEWYDYEAKYDEGEMELVVPRADLRERRASACQELARARVRRHRVRGNGPRRHVRPRDGEVLVNELNTIPGFTDDERLREALRGVGDRLRASCSSG